ncbi:hypothetical protein [Thaumasiovibrio subtropicus]|uniref:hypothetical protein n=1 Tax=Thaumasiovibrio subtropicus TaxID=1891207 RepID=UPI000B35C448|nr:hypothetical protein [Thaumasiovibrio subtropicus]
MLMNQLSELDKQINLCLNESKEAQDLQEKLMELIQRRQQLLHEIAALPTVDPIEWQQALQRTEAIVAAMSVKQSEMKSQLKQINHGQRSVKLYNKFR